MAKRLNKNEREIFDLFEQLLELDFLSGTSDFQFESKRKRLKVKTITRKLTKSQKEHKILVMNKKSWQLDEPFLIEDSITALSFFEIVKEKLGNKIINFLYNETKNRRDVWSNIGFEMFITFVSQDGERENGFPTISYLYPIRTPKDKKVTKQYLKENLGLLFLNWGEQFENYEKRNLGYAEITGVEAEAESA